MPLAVASRHELEAEIQQAIGRLSEKLQAITVLRYIESLSYEEISETLQISIGTVKSRLSRAHQVARPRADSGPRPLLARLTEPRFPIPMQTPCQSFRDELHDPQGPREAHAAECSDCAAYAERLARAARALGALERRRAPLELDGVVVAALEAGARQDRAARVLSSLGRLAAPELAELLPELGDELDVIEGTAAAARLRAPPELERLVAEELQDPAAARARRYVASLPRFAAPAELAQRLTTGTQGLRAPLAMGRSHAWSRRSLAAAAVLAFLLLLGPLRSPEEPRPRLRLVPARLADTESLDAYARSLIGGLSGGLAAVDGETR